MRNGLHYYAARGKETKDDQKWRQVARSVEDRERIMQSCHSSDEGKSTPKFNNLILNELVIDMHVIMIVMADMFTFQYSA